MREGGFSPTTEVPQARTPPHFVFLPDPQLHTRTQHTSPPTLLSNGENLRIAALRVHTVLSLQIRDGACALEGQIMSSTLRASNWLAWNLNAYPQRHRTIFLWSVTIRIVSLRS